MTSRTAVEGVLTRARPYLVADGGDIEWVKVGSPMPSPVDLDSALRLPSPGLRIVKVA